MLDLLAISAALTIVVIVATVMIYRRRNKFGNHPLAYRILLSMLFALLAPTLLMAGHGVIPLPSVAGLALSAMHAESIASIDANWIGAGTEDAAILSMPPVIVFVLSLVLGCTLFRRSTPSLPKSI